MKNLIVHFTLRPGKLFLIDSIGAGITALCLLALNTLIEPHAGLPTELMNRLIITALIFSCYSITCAGLVKNKHGFFMRMIALANTLYALFTAGLWIKYQNTLGLLSKFYFPFEIILIVGLVVLELKVASALKRGNKAIR